MYFSVVVKFYEDGYTHPSFDSRGAYHEYSVAESVYKWTIDLYKKECKNHFIVTLSKINGEIVETINEFDSEVNNND